MGKVVMISLGELAIESVPPAPYDRSLKGDCMSDRRHDFDFIFGEWKIHSRRLRDRLVGCTEWVEFDGTCVGRPIWGGAANMDEFDAPNTPWGHIQGLTVRLF